MRGADVRSIQALADLRATLLRFGADTEAALRAMDAQLQHTLKYLSERQRYWETKVRAAEEEYRRALAALRACESAGYTDPKTGRTYIPPCVQEREWVWRAGQALAEAQARLREVMEWRRLVERTAEEYRSQAQRMAAWVREELPKASGLLESKIATLQSYLAIGVSAGVGTVSTAASVISPEVAQWNIRGNSEEKEILEKARNRLQESHTGQSIASAISERHTSIQFGETPDDAIAYFDPEGNEIVINKSLKDVSPNILATHLAHEGIHVQWWDKPNSIEQEYQAFKAQAEVWNALKGGEADEQCDWVSGIIAQGEIRAKTIIRFLYPDLPEAA